MHQTVTKSLKILWGKSLSRCHFDKTLFVLPGGMFARLHLCLLGELALQLYLRWQWQRCHP